MTQLAFDFDVPGFVHGIVSLDPPRIRCDGCGYVAEGTSSIGWLVMTCGIEFDPMSTDKRRLCRECSKGRAA